MPEPEGKSLRGLPSVHELLLRLNSGAARLPHTAVVGEIRRVLDTARATGEYEAIESRVRQAVAELERPSLRRVINATGVVLHTNLGRAPLGHLTPIPGYSNLEYDLEAGRRGRRDVHADALLERLLERPSLVVNNNAAALYLAVTELAAGHEVIVSRGELIEIGDGFRIPEIMKCSGAILREVGTTNRTSIADYRDAITDRTRVLLRVHRSNFQIRGFTARPELAELVALGREAEIPVFEDLGSGCMVDLGFDEPLVSDSSADLVSFSGDKLLGGPQAGILSGKPEIIARLRRNPMFRALRVDKLILQTLEQTLRNVLFERWDDIPALCMIRLTAEQIRERAGRLLDRIPGAQLIEGRSVIGGGSTPEQSLPTWLIAIERENVTAAERQLRKSDPPVIARIENDRLLIDLRTVFPEEEAELVQALS